MSITLPQLRTIHVAARQVGLIDGDGDERYRMLLRNAAGVESSKQLTQAQFEDVMAVMEDLGYAPAGMDMGSSHYWRDKVAGRGSRANPRLVYRIRKLADQQSNYPLGALVRQHSAGRTDQVTDLRPREAWNLIEALKAMKTRSGPVAPRKSRKWPSGQVTEQESFEHTMSADDIPF